MTHALTTKQNFINANQAFRSALLGPVSRLETVNTLPVRELREDTLQDLYLTDAVLGDLDSLSAATPANALGPTEGGTPLKETRVATEHRETLS